MKADTLSCAGPEHIQTHGNTMFKPCHVYMNITWTVSVQNVFPVLSAILDTDSGQISGKKNVYVSIIIHFYVTPQPSATWLVCTLSVVGVSQEPTLSPPNTSDVHTTETTDFFGLLALSPNRGRHLRQLKVIAPFSTSRRWTWMPTLSEDSG